jgi:hypothetical protein
MPRRAVLDASSLWRRVEYGSGVYETGREGERAMAEMTAVSDLGGASTRLTCMSCFVE